MTLDQFPMNELAKILTEKFITREKYFSLDELTRYGKELDDDLLFEFSIQNQVTFLKDKHTLLTKEIKDNNLNGDIGMSSFQLIIHDRIITTLQSLDLKQMEFSNQSDIDVIQDEIERAHFYIDELTLLKSEFKANDSGKWQGIINKIISKSNANQKFLENLNRRHGRGLIDEKDNHTIDSFCHSNKDFYPELANGISRIIEKGWEAYEVLVLYVEGEPIPEETEPEFVGPKAADEKLVKIIQSYLQNRCSEMASWIKDIEEVKNNNDENAEDINFDSLLRQISIGDHKFEYNDELTLIAKRDIVVQKVKDISFEEKNGKFTTDPLIKNLALHYKMTDELSSRIDQCKAILEGYFIAETHREVFKGLFVKKGFIRKVNWIKGNRQLNYFINEIRSSLIEDGTRFDNAANCFLKDGKPAKVSSLKSDGTTKTVKGDVKQRLDRAIKCITEYQNIL